MKKLFLLTILFISFCCVGQIQHNVKRGETMFGISNKYNISITELKDNNTFLYKKGLIIGQTLAIPTFQRPIVALDSVSSRVIYSELVDCEFTKKELELIENVLKKTEANSETKDKLVGVMDDERKTVNRMAEANQQLLVNCDEEKKSLKKINDKQNIRNTVNKFVYFIAGSCLGGGFVYVILK